MTALHARALVLPDDVVRDVYVRDGVFTFTPIEGARTLAADGVMLPGLVDMHAHLALASPAATNDPQLAARASAQAQLHAGVLALREPGSPFGASRGISPEAGLPRARTGGRFISPPGGYIAGFSREVSGDELAQAVEETAAEGGGWVKLIGDFFYPDVGIGPNFDADALAVAAKVAHAGGARITIHATLPDVVAAAAEAGFDSVEHATFLDDSAIEAVKRNGTVLVPTMSIREALPNFVRQYSPSAERMEYIEHGCRVQPDLVGRAIEAGVTVLAGTDAGMVPHGTIAREIGLLAGAGMPPADAVAAGSWRARSFLGFPLIEEGAPADFVLYREDPRENLDVLRAPAAIVLDGIEVAA